MFVACSGGHRDRGGEAGGAGGRLSIKGSDTMVVLTQRLAEGYMQSHGDSVIEVSGGGSGTGVASLLNGTTEIANMSRPLSERERQQLSEHGFAAVETPVALDALAMYVHESNPVGSLTIAQLRDVFTGRITRWSELGGADVPIVLYSRENNSGTYVYFKERVLDGRDFAVSAQTLPGTSAVINAVSLDPKSIGYGGIGYGTGVKTLSIPADDGTLVEPTMENTTSGRYPLSRSLFMVTRGEPQGVARDFIDWVRGPSGQSLVDQVGFYPLRHAVSP